MMTSSKPQVFVYTNEVIVQVYNWITHYLTWPVVGNVPPLFAGSTQSRPSSVVLHLECSFYRFFPTWKLEGVPQKEVVCGFCYALWVFTVCNFKSTVLVVGFGNPIANRRLNQWQIQPFSFAMRFVHQLEQLVENPPRKHRAF